MRSELVYSAEKQIPNRYELCKTASVATRNLHINSTPTEHTINRVLQEISGSYRPAPRMEEIPAIAVAVSPTRKAA